MSFGPIINESNQAPAKGAPTDTGTWYITGPVGGGSTTAMQTLTSMDDFIAAYTDRTVSGSVATYDACETAFREGAKKINVGAFTSTGGKTYADGLALLNDERQGPGQMSAIGTTVTAQMIEDFLAVCDACNRVALFDVGSGDTIADMVTKGGYLPDNADLAGMFSSWVNVPGPSGVIGAGPRVVPASAVIAGMCNRVDADGNPNRAPGGRDYPAQYMTSALIDPVASDRINLWNAGVNAFMYDFGVWDNYGFQTNITPTTTTPFWQLNCSRARMWLKANAKAIAAKYYMRPIDGEGILVGKLAAELDNLCYQLWDKGGLYGKTPAQAYANTPQETDADAAIGNLKVVNEARYSLYAKTVEIDLVSVPVVNAISS